MFGKLGDIMGKLKELKQKSVEIKSSLENKIIKTEEHGVEIQINGNRKILRISIPDELKRGADIEMENKMIAAINKAIEAANSVNEEEMKKIAGSLIPGLNL